MKSKIKKNLSNKTMLLIAVATILLLSDFIMPILVLAETAISDDEIGRHSYSDEIESSPNFFVRTSFDGEILSHRDLLFINIDIDTANAENKEIKAEEKLILNFSNPSSVHEVMEVNASEGFDTHFDYSYESETGKLKVIFMEDIPENVSFSIMISISVAGKESEQGENISNITTDFWNLDGEISAVFVANNAFTVNWIEETTQNAYTNSQQFTSEYNHDNQETYIEERSEGNVIAGMWGTVPWTYDPDEKTIFLEGGIAGEVAYAPWKTYTLVKQIVFEDRVELPEDSSMLFARLRDLISIENENNLDTSNVTNMSGMFNLAISLTEVDVTSWDTSKVIDMNYMFGTARSLTELNVSNWDTSKVIDMNYMFGEARSLTELDVSNWDTSSVTNMSGMFNDVGLTELDVSKWNTSSVNNMVTMFANTDSLTELDVSKWDTSSVTNMSGMFAFASNLTKLDLSGWNTSNVTDMTAMFMSADSLAELDVSKWDTSKVISMAFMFHGASKLTELDLSTWDTKNVTSSQSIFEGTNQLSKLTLGQYSVFQNRTMLPNISVNSIFTGRWILVKDRLGNKPSQQIIYQTSSAFMDSYDGTTPGTYVWERSHAAPVTVRYEDSKGNQLSEPTILNGKIGLPYESEDKEIQGWYVTETPSNAHGTFSEKEQEVVYVYERSDAAPVTVRYEDSKGNQLSEPTVLSGKVGLPYKTGMKEIRGWYLVETPSNANGTFSEEAQEVIYVYDREIDQGGTGSGERDSEEMGSEERDKEEIDVDLSQDNQNKKDLPLLGAKEGLPLLGVGLNGLAMLATKLKSKKKLDEE